MPDTVPEATRRRLLELNRQLALQPQAQTWLAKGLCYYALKDADREIHCYRRRLEIDPESSEAPTTSPWLTCRETSSRGPTPSS